MNIIATNLTVTSLNWLQKNVFPLWSTAGVDSSNGSFTESLKMDGTPNQIAKRALVQARQMYSFATASKLNVFDSNKSKNIIKDAAEFFIANYLSPTGGCVHAVEGNGTVKNSDKDLYTQAFALFALANAYQVLGEKKYQTHAFEILKYLRNERRAVSGGYTEIKAGTVMYQSNPHMHLFESALFWAKIDSSKEWSDLCHELYDLCINKFIDTETGYLCEHFNEGWIPQRVEGNFIFEPGHHFEWSWLLSNYEDQFKIDCKNIRHSLYELGTKFGVNKKNFTIDEVWSNGNSAKISSRFWPQCERIKAAVKLGLEVEKSHQKEFALHADEALTVLQEYFRTETIGLWQDQLLESGEFSKVDPKGSSLYHIINAIDEYVSLRDKLAD